MQPQPMPGAKSGATKTSIYRMGRMKMHGVYVGATKTPYRFLFVVVALAVAAFLAGVPLGASLPLSSLSSDGTETGTGNQDDGSDGGDDGDDDEGGDDGDGEGGNEGGKDEEVPGGDVVVRSGNRVTRAPIEARQDFVIQITCTRGFQVNAIFVVAESRDPAFDIVYERARAKGDFAGTGVLFWDIFSSAFDLPPGAALTPQELLGPMDLDQVPVPGGGYLIVEGFVQSNSDGTLSVGVVLETSRSAECRVEVVP